MNPFLKYMTFIILMLILCFAIPQNLHLGNSNNNSLTRVDTSHSNTSAQKSLVDTLPASKEFLAGEQTNIILK